MGCAGFNEISFGEGGSKRRPTFTGVVRDITERKRTEAVRSALYLVAERAQASTDMTELYAGIGAALRELMGAKSFRVMLKDVGSGALECVYLAGEALVVPGPRDLADEWTAPGPMLAMRDDTALVAHVLEQLKDPEQFLNKVRPGDHLRFPGLSRGDALARSHGRQISAEAARNRRARGLPPGYRRHRYGAALHEAGLGPQRLARGRFCPLALLPARPSRS